MTKYYLRAFFPNYYDAVHYGKKFRPIVCGINARADKLTFIGTYEDREAYVSSEEVENEFIEISEDMLRAIKINSDLPIQLVDWDEMIHSRRDIKPLSKVTEWDINSVARSEGDTTREYAVYELDEAEVVETRKNLLELMYNTWELAESETIWDNSPDWDNCKERAEISLCNNVRALATLGADPVSVSTCCVNEEVE